MNICDHILDISLLKEDGYSYYENWTKIKTLTKNSQFNHSYFRRPVNYKVSFCFFWTSGHLHQLSKTELYFGDFDGNLWKLPYEMKEDFEKPLEQ